MSFRGAFGATPQRQSSGSLGGAALPSPSAYTRSNGSFPFQGAGLASPTPLSPNAPNGHASAASALLEPNLDPSDFPALSGGSLAPSQQSSLVSSYASQAGTALPPGALHPSTILGGSLSPAGTLPTVASALMGLPPRDFSSDDFPALGGFAAAHHDIGMGLPSNLASTNGSPAPPRSTSSEQASAAAALQHQQAALQHRANLLGSMNGNPTFGLKQAPTNPQWTSSPTLANPTLSTQLDTLHLSNGGIGPTMDQQPSPSLLSTTTTTTGPPGVARAIGGTTSAAPTSPLPPNATISNPPPTGTIPQTPAQQVLFSPADRYGLLGLLHIIKTSDPDLSMLALGSDLTSLGLDLGATENLYSTFITPWSDSKAFSQLNIEPEFTLPSCYNVQPPPAQTKIGNFSDETLFFIFYSQPRDAMQEMAAHELYKHNWRYHKELRLWLTKEAGTEPTQKTQSYERGSYIFFDPTLWERVKKDFVLVFESLERKL